MSSLKEILVPGLVLPLKSLLIFFIKIESYVIIIYLCMCEGTCRGSLMKVRDSHRSQYSDFPILVPGTEFRYSDWLASIFVH